MKDLKKIYNDMMTANPNEVTKFKWGSTSPSDVEGCICIQVDVKCHGDLCLFIECEQNEHFTFELFKEIYIDALDRLIKRIKWEFESLP